LTRDKNLLFKARYVKKRAVWQEGLRRWNRKIWAVTFWNTLKTTDFPGKEVMMELEHLKNSGSQIVAPEAVTFNDTGVAKCEMCRQD
jgi:hypothetical protein